MLSLFNSAHSHQRALVLADADFDADHVLADCFRRVLSRSPTDDERARCRAHWETLLASAESLRWSFPRPPAQIRREAIEENTGERFEFSEVLPGAAEFIPDIDPDRLDRLTRALATVCLALFNSNEFLTID